MGVYIVMQVATELMTKEAICDSETSDNSGPSHILYVLSMILTKLGLFKKKKKTQNIACFCYFVMLQMP